MNKVKITHVREGVDKNGHEYKLGLYNVTRTVPIDKDSGCLDFQKESNPPSCVLLYDKSQWDLLTVGCEVIVD
jgi:hypothetical protein|tara:strand:+ start:2586 stop:2804 length:219 start_codon:yes stop_codon:yes gene_type:complete